MSENDLGPMPTPTAEEPEPAPGGADSADNPAYGDAGPDDGTQAGRDLDPANNPAVDNVVPDEVVAPDDKAQAPVEDPVEAQGSEGAEGAEAAADAPVGTEPPA